MERLWLDDLPSIRPASFPDIPERTITVVCASKELHRVGWIVGPQHPVRYIGVVSMANVVVPVGSPRKLSRRLFDYFGTAIPEHVHELKLRRNLCTKELEEMPFGKPDGGWCLLFRVETLGREADAAAKALLKHRACVTPMLGWRIDEEAQYFGIVFSNESRERLRGLGEIVCKALLE